MSIQPRSGIPHVFQLSAGTDGAINAGATTPAYVLRYGMPAQTMWLAVQAVDKPVRVYFTAEDHAVDARYVEVADQFSGPLAVRELWFRGVGGTSNFTLVATCRG